MGTKVQKMCKIMKKKHAKKIYHQFQQKSLEHLSKVKIEKKKEKKISLESSDTYAKKK